MSARQQALALIEQAGAEFDEWDDDGLQGAVYAPAGVMWRTTQCHTIAVSFYTDRPAGWRWLAAELAAGTEPCDDSGCNICTPVAGVMTTASG